VRKLYPFITAKGLKWTLQDLIDACSDALYEYEGIDRGVSKRTVQSDIQIMRSDKLGYNAPIVVVDRKYYIENGVMQIIPGSQGKFFTKDEIKTITKNSIPRICEMSSGAIHIYNPMILHSVLPPTTSQKRMVIQMEYTQQKN